MASSSRQHLASNSDAPSVSNAKRNESEQSHLNPHMTRSRARQTHATLNDGLGMSGTGSRKKREIGAVKKKPATAGSSSFKHIRSSVKRVCPQNHTGDGHALAAVAASVGTAADIQASCFRSPPTAACSSSVTQNSSVKPQKFFAVAVENSSTITACVPFAAAVDATVPAVPAPGNHMVQPQAACASRPRRFFGPEALLPSDENKIRQSSSAESGIQNQVENAEAVAPTTAATQTGNVSAVAATAVANLPNLSFDLKNIMPNVDAEMNSATIPPAPLVNSVENNTTPAAQPPRQEPEENRRHAGLLLGTRSKFLGIPNSEPDKAIVDADRNQRRLAQTLVEVTLPKISDGMQQVAVALTKLADDYRTIIEKATGAVEDSSKNAANLSENMRRAVVEKQRQLFQQQQRLSRQCSSLLNIPELERTKNTASCARGSGAGAARGGDAGAAK